MLVVWLLCLFVKCWSFASKRALASRRRWRNAFPWTRLPSITMGEKIANWSLSVFATFALITASVCGPEARPPTLARAGEGTAFGKALALALALALGAGAAGPAAGADVEVGGKDTPEPLLTTISN